MGCSIITSRVGGEWVSAFLVMLRDGKPKGWVVKKVIKPFFVLLLRDPDFIITKHE